MNQTSACTACSRLKVGKFENGKLVWSEIASSDLNLIISSSVYQFVIVLAKVEEFKSCPVCRPLFIAGFRIPDSWWSTRAKQSGGYFGSSNTFDDSDELDGLSNNILLTYMVLLTDSATWYRFHFKTVKPHSLSEVRGLISANVYELYPMNWIVNWQTNNILTRWMAKTKVMISLLMIDRGERTAEAIETKLQTRFIRPATSPYYIHSVLVEVSLDSYHSSVLDLRSMIRDTEKGRFLSVRTQSIDMFRERLRHILDSIEMLRRNISMSRAMFLAHQRWAADTTVEQSKANNNLIASSFTNSINDMEQLLYRAEALQERMRTELQITSTQSSIDIAKTAAEDADTMRWLAVLGATFLPGTFIAAIFSMSFFNIDNGVWSLHPKFWIYWAFAIPFSVVTLIVIYTRRIYRRVLSKT